METTKTQKISLVQFEGELMIVRTGEQTYKWNIKEISKRLSNASDSERNNFQISPSGYGIHWPLIDEDLSLNGLLFNCK
ncbi:MAG TPA: DUF2442 domain-containing protein [Saprospiraceae bacterium]|nr:DUF2442 domain-containing protein [Saprospiraceae bacterium]